MLHNLNFIELPLWLDAHELYELLSVGEDDVIATINDLASQLYLKEEKEQRQGGNKKRIGNFLFAQSLQPAEQLLMQIKLGENISDQEVWRYYIYWVATCEVLMGRELILVEKRAIKFHAVFMARGRKVLDVTRSQPDGDVLTGMSSTLLHFTRQSISERHMYCNVSMHMMKAMLRELSDMPGSIAEFVINLMNRVERRTLGESLNGGVAMLICELLSYTCVSFNVAALLGMKGIRQTISQVIITHLIDERLDNKMCADRVSKLRDDIVAYPIVYLFGTRLSNNNLVDPCIFAGRCLCNDKWFGDKLQCKAQTTKISVNEKYSVSYGECQGAISHVWAQELLIDNSNGLLHKIHSKYGKLWLDYLCKEPFNGLQCANEYKNLVCVVDKYAMQSKDALEAIGALAISDWSNRGWTFQEAQLATRVDIIVHNAESITIKDAGEWVVNSEFYEFESECLSWLKSKFPKTESVWEQWSMLSDRAWRHDEDRVRCMAMALRMQEATYDSLFSSEPVLVTMLHDFHGSNNHGSCWKPQHRTSRTVVANDDGMIEVEGVSADGLRLTGLFCVQTNNDTINRLFTPVLLKDILLRRSLTNCYLLIKADNVLKGIPVSINRMASTMGNIVIHRLPSKAVVVQMNVNTGDMRPDSAIMAGTGLPTFINNAIL